MNAPDFRPLPRPYRVPKDTAAHERFGLIVASIHHYLNIHPGWADHKPHEAQSALWSLGYTDELLPRSELETALQFVRIPVGRRRD